MARAIRNAIRANHSQLKPLFRKRPFVHKMFVHNFCAPSPPPPNQQSDGFPLEFLLKGAQTELRTVRPQLRRNPPKIANRIMNKRAFPTIFIACQVGSHESLEFLIRANRANRFARITPLSALVIGFLVETHFEASKTLYLKAFQSPQKMSRLKHDY